MKLSTAIHVSLCFATPIVVGAAVIEFGVSFCVHAWLSSLRCDLSFPSLKLKCLHAHLFIVPQSTQDQPFESLQIDAASPPARIPRGTQNDYEPLSMLRGGDDKEAHRVMKSGTKTSGGSGSKSSKSKSKSCDPSKVVLADYQQWQDEEGYWVGEYSFYGSDGLPNNSTSWPYNYQTYRGFITGNTACNKYRQRNLFLYKAWNEALEGSSRIFFADQEATTTCDGNIEGPYSLFGIDFETETTLIGRDNAVLYQVYHPTASGTLNIGGQDVPFTCEESIFQSQLTTLNTRPDGVKQRTRTAQGFYADCSYNNLANFGGADNRGKQQYASFYRETKVTKDEFYAQLNATVVEYKIPQSNLGAFLGSGLPSGNSGYAFIEDHLESSFELQCD